MTGNFNYDDGYVYNHEELEGAFLNEAELPENYARAYILSNGDVIRINDLLLKFEDNLFYEVKEPVGFINAYYEPTGKIFTPEELNNMKF